MKKQLLMLYAIFFSVIAYSQNTDTALISSSAPTSLGIQKGMATVDGSLKLETGGSLTIFAGAFLTAKNEITNLGDGANFLVESDASLLQGNDDAVNTGNVTVKRSANMKRLDYTYWASPVAGQNLKTFSPGTVNTRFLTYKEGDDKFYSIDPTVNIFGNRADGIFGSAAKGYAIRASNNYSPTQLQVFNGTFAGVPNNGKITFPLEWSSAGQGYNLVGNPYPSNLNFYDLQASNTDLIYNSAYFWTNINPNPAMQGSGYPGTGFFNNYAVLNGTGGVNATTSTSSAGGTNIPNEFIKVGQGFIVKAKTAGLLTFDNLIRTANSTGTFFNKNTPVPVDRYRLNLTTPLNVVTTQLIGYKPEATNGFEADYDAPLLVTGSDAFYSILGDEKLAIQGKAPFVNTDVVPLGSSQYAAGNYTISLATAEGIFANGQKIYLKDLQTGALTNLSERSYSFISSEGVTEGRFQIVYQSETVLGTADAFRENLVIYRNGNDFIIKSSAKNISEVSVYDSSGRLTATQQPHQKETLLEGSQLINGVYILKINREGAVITKKIVK